MAKQLLFNQSGGGGGGLSGGTTLWQNTGSLDSFTAQDVTLSESIENYELIWIKYIAKDGRVGNEEWEVCMRSSDLMKTGIGGSGDNFKPKLALLINGNNYDYFRYVYMKNETTMNFSSAGRSGATYNTACIPMEIVGY